MASLNSVYLIGNLVKDPELKTLESGEMLCKFSIAINDTYKNKAGEKVENTTFLNIDVFGKQAENAAKFLSKGKMIFVDGKIKTRSWENDAGVKFYATDILAKNIQYLSPKGDGGTDAQKIEVNQNFTSSDIPF